jgi:hypothetical protein
MRLPRRLPRLFLRHALAVAALLAQVVAAVGAPAFSPRSAKSGAAPFPCQNHPCGCATPEQGWAGDCCCFTLEQKLAWAVERSIEPPPHVRATVEARASARKQKAKPSCCATSEKTCCENAKEGDGPPAVRWVAGIFAQKCRGDGTAGLFKFEVGFPPVQSPEAREPRTVCDFAPPTNSTGFTTSLRPPLPPPRVS